MGSHAHLKAMCKCVHFHAIITCSHKTASIQKPYTVTHAQYYMHTHTKAAYTPFTHYEQQGQRGTLLC